MPSLGFRSEENAEYSAASTLPTHHHKPKRSFMDWVTKGAPSLKKFKRKFTNSQTNKKTETPVQVGIRPHSHALATMQQENHPNAQSSSQNPILDIESPQIPNTRTFVNQAIPVKTQLIQEPCTRTPEIQRDSSTTYPPVASTGSTSGQPDQSSSERNTNSVVIGPSTKTLQEASSQFRIPGSPTCDKQDANRAKTDIHANAERDTHFQNPGSDVDATSQNLVPKHPSINQHLSRISSDLCNDLIRSWQQDATPPLPVQEFKNSDVSSTQICRTQAKVKVQGASPSKFNRNINTNKNTSSTTINNSNYANNSNNANKSDKANNFSNSNQNTTPKNHSRNGANTRNNNSNTTTVGTKNNNNTSLSARHQPPESGNPLPEPKSSSRNGQSSRSSSTSPSTRASIESVANRRSIERNPNNITTTTTTTTASRTPIDRRPTQYQRYMEERRKNAEHETPILIDSFASPPASIVSDLLPESSSAEFQHQPPRQSSRSTRRAYRRQVSDSPSSVQPIRCDGSESSLSIQPIGCNGSESSVSVGPMGRDGSDSVSSFQPNRYERSGQGSLVPLSNSQQLVWGPEHAASRLDRSQISSRDCANVPALRISECYRDSSSAYFKVSGASAPRVSTPLPPVSRRDVSCSAALLPTHFSTDCNGGCRGGKDALPSTMHLGRQLVLVLLEGLPETWKAPVNNYRGLVSEGLNVYLLYTFSEMANCFLCNSDKGPGVFIWTLRVVLLLVVPLVIAPLVLLFSQVYSAAARKSSERESSIPEYIYDEESGDFLTPQESLDGFAKEAAHSTRVMKPPVASREEQNGRRLPREEQRAQQQENGLKQLQIAAQLHAQHIPQKNSHQTLL